MTAGIKTRWRCRAVGRKGRQGAKKRVRRFGGRQGAHQQGWSAFNIVSSSVGLRAAPKGNGVRSVGMGLQPTQVR